MADLSVAEYDAAEQEAILELPNRIIEAYQPVVFQEIGYPFRVRRESELFKYIDVMHEQRFENDFAHLMGGGLAVNEFELLKRLTELIYLFSETSFQKKMIARASILRSLNVFRHIRYLFGDARPRVFEIGPGCGYLGAMLMLEGYPYAATDVAQAFYLYQNHFWNFISDGKVLDLARYGLSNEELAAPSPGGAVHIPWWEFVKLRPESVSQFDIVTANHVLCEMHPDSLGFALRITQALLRGDETPKAFVFEGWGAELQKSKASVAKEFYRFGFSIVHNDRWITVIAPCRTESAVDYLSLPKISKSYRFSRLRLQNILRRLAGAAPLAAYEPVDYLSLPKISKSYRFSRLRLQNILRRLAGAAPLTAYEPCEYASTLNPLSRSILSGRASQQAIRTVGIEQVNSFYTGLLGSEDHLSPDERFWKFVRR